MRRLGAAALLLAGIAPSAGWGQGWAVDIAAGGIDHETVAADVGTRSGILGLRYDGPRWLYLTLGAPLDTTGSPWAAVGLGGRVEAERRAFTLGVDLGAHGHGYREPAAGATGAGGVLEALPFIGLTSGTGWVELHSGLRAYSAVYDDSTFSRGVIDTGARAGWSPGSLEVAAEATLVHSAEGSFPYLGADAELALSRVTGWTTLGRWFSDEIPTMVWGAGATVSMTRTLALDLSVQQESRDPLYWNLPRRMWAIGLSRSLGGRRVVPAASTVFPPSAAATAGRVVIRLPVADADSAPALGGDFTGWESVPMTRSGEEWVAEFPLEAGVYRYAFRKADGSWFVPSSVLDRVDDGFGGVSAVLVVR